MSSKGKTKPKPGGSAKYPNPKDKAKGPQGGQAESPQERKERIRRIRKEHPELR